MLKEPNTPEDCQLFYYNYINNLYTLFNVLSYQKINKNHVYTILSELNIPVHNQELKPFIDSILQRISNYTSEAIVSYQKEFFSYLGEYLLYHTVRDYEEEIEKIIQKPFSYVDFDSFLIDYESFYNSPEYAPCTAIMQNIKKMNRFLYLEQYLLFFEDYFNIYQNSINVTLFKEELLTLPWKMYIGMMTVAAMKNEYLMCILEESFLNLGGDRMWWIHGIDIIPNKLKSISAMVQILTHQPWRMSSEMINQLINKGWNWREITEALTVIVKVHQIIIWDNCFKRFAGRNTDKSVSPKKTELNEILKQLDKNEIDDIFKQVVKPAAKPESQAVINDRNIKSFNNNRIESKPAQSAGTGYSVIFNKFICEEYIDFKYEYPGGYNTTFWDYNYIQNGKYTLINYNQSNVESIDHEINFIIKLKQREDSVNLWNDYSMKLTVIRFTEMWYAYYHEDFDNKAINSWWNENIKTALKVIVRDSGKFADEHFDDLRNYFEFDELVHLVLILGCTKARLQLMYSARAIYDTVKCNEN